MTEEAEPRRPHDLRSSTQHVAFAQQAFVAAAITYGLRQDTYVVRNVDVVEGVENQVFLVCVLFCSYLDIIEFTPPHTFPAGAAETVVPQDFKTYRVLTMTTQIGQHELQMLT